MSSRAPLPRGEGGRGRSYKSCDATCVCGSGCHRRSVDADRDFFGAIANKGKRPRRAAFADSSNAYGRGSPWLLTVTVCPGGEVIWMRCSVPRKLYVTS